ncbi:MAG TPA: Ni/Fe-hydrogenase, b-type cytochrome subunit [Syntrophales bacterium]|mgnify:CR=1 FL=1|nr:Ni/Fe-hydrogenase, b-type cytochrome subunit [Syntrophales bacterium]HPQ43019.1 Ni/Fe-hydrogenase, b-type cytochrome subunit [Syntrophales bacterium]
MEAIVPKKEWAVPMRINHWATAVTIGVLIVTGFYIAEPFSIGTGETVDKFFMGDVRFWHIFFGVVLLFLFIWRVYLAFFSRFHADWKDFLAWVEVKDFIRQVKFYLLISRERPKHEYLYGPLQSLAYAGFFLLLLMIVLTGLILLGAGYHAGWTGFIYSLVKPFETMMGGLAMVRWIHHILMWLMIPFIVVHVYMAFWYDAVIKEGIVSGMINGRVFKKSHT